MDQNRIDALGAFIAANAVSVPAPGADKATDELPLCPFCGGRAVRIGYEKNLIQCTECKVAADNAAWNRRAAVAAAGAPVQSQPHPDDIAVDRTAAAMKAKMAASRAKGHDGWDNPALCSVEKLAYMLIEHVAKGDAIDVADFAMMLHNRGADHFALSEAMGVYLSKHATYALTPEEMEAALTSPSGDHKLVADVSKLVELDDPELDAKDLFTRVFLLAEYWKREAKKARAAAPLQVSGATSDEQRDLSDEGIVKVLASFGIDADKSKYGFPELQVSTNIPGIRKVINAYLAAPAGAVAVAAHEETLRDWLSIIHDNELSLGDRLQRISVRINNLLEGEPEGRHPPYVIREQFFCACAAAEALGRASNLPAPQAPDQTTGEKK